MGAGITSLQDQHPLTSCYWVRLLPQREIPWAWSSPVQSCYHKSPRNTNQNQKPASIPGGVYTICPLETVSIWAALKLKLIGWHHLRVWIALHEVRTWRDTQDPPQRNIFRFTPRRIAQALGYKYAGPRLKKALADLERLGLARLAPTELPFTPSLHDLPPELREETHRILNALGNDCITRAIRMPRRLMRHIMRSRSRPLRAALIFAMLLRVMPVKRYGWYKGCLTTALLAEVSGFSESRIKHERAALIKEGYFERLETPVRVRQQHGDWYALARHLPASSGSQNSTNKQPPRPSKEQNPQPPIEEPVPSSGIETNQFLPRKPGASRSLSPPNPTAAPSWHRIQPEDLREPQRRVDLHKDACRIGAIGNSPAERLKFYAAVARARRLGTVNPCGMLRRIAQTTAYHAYIAQCDEDQARAWLRELEPQPQPELLALVTPPTPVDSGPADVEVYRALALSLMREGYDPNGHGAYDIVRREIKSNQLRRWTRQRWEAAKAEALGQHLRPTMPHHRRGGTGNL